MISHNELLRQIEERALERRKRAKDTAVAEITEQMKKVKLMPFTLILTNVNPDTVSCANAFLAEHGFYNTSTNVVNDAVRISVDKNKPVKRSGGQSPQWRTNVDHFATKIFDKNKNNQSAFKSKMTGELTLALEQTRATSFPVEVSLSVMKEDHNEESRSALMDMLAELGYNNFEVTSKIKAALPSDMNPFDMNPFDIKLDRNLPYPNEQFSAY